MEQDDLSTNQDGRPFETICSIFKKKKKKKKSKKKKKKAQGQRVCMFVHSPVPRPRVLRLSKHPPIPTYPLSLVHRLLFPFFRVVFETARDSTC